MQNNDNYFTIEYPNSSGPSSLFNFLSVLLDYNYDFFIEFILLVLEYEKKILNLKNYKKIKKT